MSVGTLDLLAEFNNCSVLRFNEETGIIRIECKKYDEKPKVISIKITNVYPEEHFADLIKSALFRNNNMIRHMVLFGWKWLPEERLFTGKLISVD